VSAILPRPWGSSTSPLALEAFHADFLAPPIEACLLVPALWERVELAWLPRSVRGELRETWTNPIAPPPMVEPGRSGTKSKIQVFGGGAALSLVGRG
jgi:hypothetical protein